MSRTTGILLLTLALLAVPLASGQGGTPTTYHADDPHAFPYAMTDAWFAPVAHGAGSLFQVEGPLIHQYDSLQGNVTQVFLLQENITVLAANNQYVVAAYIDPTTGDRLDGWVLHRTSNGWTSAGGFAPQPPNMVRDTVSVSVALNSSNMAVAFTNATGVHIHTYRLGNSGADHLAHVDSIQGSNLRVGRSGVSMDIHSIAVGITDPLQQGRAYTWDHFDAVTPFGPRLQVPTPADATSQFGYTVQLEGYGSLLVSDTGRLADSNATRPVGRVHRYEANVTGMSYLHAGASSWIPSISLMHPEDVRSGLGASIAVTGWADGRRYLVGAPTESYGPAGGFPGAVYLFDADGDILARWHLCDPYGDELLGHDVFFETTMTDEHVYFHPGPMFATGGGPLDNAPTPLWSMYRLPLPGGDCDDDDQDDDQDDEQDDDQDDEQDDDQDDNDDQDDGDDQDDEQDGGNNTQQGCLQDCDNDGVPDHADNCPGTANRDQGDRDDDGVGDACDDSDDRPAPPTHNTTQPESDEGPETPESPQTDPEPETDAGNDEPGETGDNEGSADEDSQAGVRARSGIDLQDRSATATVGYDGAGQGILIGVLIALPIVGVAAWAGWRRRP